MIYFNCENKRYLNGLGICILKRSRGLYFDLRLTGAKYLRHITFSIAFKRKRLFCFSYEKEAIEYSYKREMIEDLCFDKVIDITKMKDLKEKYLSELKV